MDMGLGLLAAAEKILGETDYCVRVGQVVIQRQGLLAFSNALVRAVLRRLDETHVHLDNDSATCSTIGFLADGTVWRCRQLIRLFLIPWRQA
jgi:hypothetical protein